jgi:hypothetical protein
MGLQDLSSAEAIHRAAHQTPQIAVPMDAGWHVNHPAAIVSPGSSPVRHSDYATLHVIRLMTHWNKDPAVQRQSCGSWDRKGSATGDWKRRPALLLSVAQEDMHKAAYCHQSSVSVVSSSPAAHVRASTAQLASADCEIVRDTHGVETQRFHAFRDAILQDVIEQRIYRESDLDALFQRWRDVNPPEYQVCATVTFNTHSTAQPLAAAVV